MRWRGHPLAVLSVAFLLIGLFTSRVTLVLHEFVGHGGAAASLGADLLDHRLFLFGGGWVRYDRSTPFSTAESVYVSMAGVGLEILLGALALLLARRFRPGSVERLAACSFGALDLLHSGFYLATGIHHGFGDGLVLYRLLGGAREAVAWPLAAAVVAGGFFGGRRLARLAAPWLVFDRRPARLAALIAAALLAAAVHGGLALAEATITADPTYAEIMKREAERDAERALARFVAARQRRGIEPSRSTLAAKRRELIEERRPFPLRDLLAIALGLAVALGAATGVGKPDPSPLPPPGGGPGWEGHWRPLRPLAICCALSILVVLALRRP